MPSCNILLGEADPIIAMHLQVLMEALGHRVALAGNLQEAMTRCEQLQPQVAVLNFKQDLLPDGHSITEALLSRFPMRVILLTGMRSKDIDLPQNRLYPVQVLHKPFTEIQFQKSLETLLVSQAP